MGKTAQIIAGIGIIVGAGIILIASGGSSWQLSAAIAIQGGSLIANAVQGARPLAEQQGAILENRTGAKQGVPVVYGTTRLGPILADVRVDASSQNRKRLVVVCAFAHGSSNGTGVEDIVEIFLDDQLAWTQAGGVQAPFNTTIDDAGDPIQTVHLKVNTHFGTTSDPVDANLNSLFPTEWPTTSQGKSVCYVVLFMWFNNDVFASNLPRINAVIKGNRLADPRSGATTVFSTNPALAIRDYLTSSIYGFAEAVADIDDASFEVAADFCDELVTPLSGGSTQKRFEVGGWIDTKRPIRANLADLATSCRATMINIGGVWKIIIRKQQSVSGLKLTTDNTVEGSWHYLIPGSGEVPNSVVVNYIDPDRNYQADSVQWPEPGETNPHLIDDSNFINQMNMDLPFTDDRLRAQQIAMTVLREMREGIAVTVQAKEDMLQAEVGDIVEITQPSPAWVDKPFWVVATNYQPMLGVIDLILIEFEPTVYDIENQFAQPTIPNTGLPDPFTVAAPTGLVLTAGDAESIVTADGIRIVRIKMDWTAPVEPFLDHYEVEAKKNTETDFDSYGTIPKEETTFFVSPATSELWDVRIRAINTLGVHSAYLTGSITPSVTASITSAESVEVADTTARYRLRETDQTLPLGLWGLTLEGDQLRIQKNTAVAGDFSTFNEFFTMAADGVLTLPQRVLLTNTDDVDLVGVSGALIIGGNGTGQHLALDGNEMMSKTSATVAGTLHLQIEGGTLHLGGAGTTLQVDNTALVTNLNADRLDSQQGSFYQDAANLNAGVLLNARVQQSNVTQHEAALSIAETQITGVLNVVRGGTGVASPTSGRLLVGAGVSAMTLLAPGAAAGYVRSNGSAWVRSALLAADLTGTILPSNIVTSSLTAVGALNTGSIVSGFGAINVGSDTITSGGLLPDAAGTRDIGNATTGRWNVVYLDNALRFTDGTTSLNALRVYGFAVAGHRIGLGAGAQTIVGAGEAADTANTNIGSFAEDLWLAADSEVKIVTNIQPGWGSRREWTFSTAGVFTTPGDVTIDQLGTFDAASIPNLDDVLRFNGTKWVAAALQFRFTDGDVVAQAYTDGTASAHVDDGRAVDDTPPPVAPSAAPILTAGYKTIVVDMSAHTLPADKKLVVQWSTDAGVTWSNDGTVDEIVTTGDKVIHTKLLIDGTTYRYRFRERGATTSAPSPETADLAPLSEPDINVATIILASQISTVDLSSLSANIGVITAGLLRNSADTHGILLSGAMTDSSPSGWNRFINLVDETDSFIGHEQFDLLHDGTAIFKGVARDTNSKMVVDFPNRLLTIIDEQGTPRTRVKIGEISTGLGDWGLQVFSDAGVLLFDAQAANLQIGDQAGTVGINVKGTLPGSWTTFIDFTATGNSAVIKHPGLILEADGDADFSGIVSSEQLISGRLAVGPQASPDATATVSILHNRTESVDSTHVVNSGEFTAAAINLTFRGIVSRPKLDIVAQTGIEFERMVVGHPSFADLKAAGGSVTVYGLRIFDAVLGAFSGTFTTQYGLKIEDVSNAGTKYAIFTGTGLVRFGDTIESAVATGSVILNWAGTGFSEMQRLTDQGGIGLGCDSSMLLHAGDNFNNLKAAGELNIVAGTTTETLHLTADGDVSIRSNRQTSFAASFEWKFNNAGNLIAPGEVDAQQGQFGDGTTTAVDYSIVALGTSAGTPSNPKVVLDEADGVANERIWDMLNAGGTFLLRARNDADTLGTTLISAARSAHTIGAVTAGGTWDFNEPLTASGQHRVRAFHSVSQDTGSGGTITVAFDSETYDVGAMHDNVTNNSRITIKEAGRYLLHFQAEAADIGGGDGQGIVRFRKNVAATIMVEQRHDYIGTFATSLNILTMLDLVVDDFIVVTVQSSAGDNLRITAGESKVYFEALLLAA